MMMTPKDLIKDQQVYKLFPEIAWLKQGTSVDALNMHNGKLLKLPQGVAISEPWIKPTGAVGGVWQCRVQYVMHGQTLYIDLDPFGLLSFRRNAQILLICLSLLSGTAGGPNSD